MMTNFRMVALMGVALLAVPAASRADILLPSPVLSVSGPGVATGISVTTAPNNYPSPTPSNNLTVGVTLNTMAAPLDVVLQGTNSGGTTEYLATVTVANSTGSTFTGYQFQLGTGTGTTFVQYSSATLANFGTSANPPAPTSNQFSSFSLASEILTFSGGSIAPGGVGTFTFNLVVPDYPSSPNSFTLRETPLSVPAPASLLLMASGLTGLLGRLAWRRRAIA